VHQKSIFWVSRGVKFLEKRRENVQIFQALRWRFDIWEAIFAVKNDGMVYSIKHYVIKFVSDLRQVCGILWVLQFRHKSSNWNIFESGFKHLTSNGQMMDQTFVYVVHHTTTTAQVQLRWKVIVLLILMEFMIITVYKLSFHINQWTELVCWKYALCWGSLDGICILNLFLLFMNETKI
jgi:hypothetical protein